MSDQPAAWRSSADIDEKAEITFWLKADGSVDWEADLRPAMSTALDLVRNCDLAAAISCELNWLSASSTMAESERLERPDRST
ncbi:hypothetical protein D3C87_1913380 [compost metagenome]